MSYCPTPRPCIEATVASPRRHPFTVDRLGGRSGWIEQDPADIVCAADLEPGYIFRRFNRSRPPWMADAACHGTPVDVFFHPSRRRCTTQPQGHRGSITRDRSRCRQPNRPTSTPTGGTSSPGLPGEHPALAVSYIESRGSRVNAGIPALVSLPQGHRGCSRRRVAPFPAAGVDAGETPAGDCGRLSVLNPPSSKGASECRISLTRPPTRRSRTT